MIRGNPLNSASPGSCRAQPPAPLLQPGTRMERGVFDGMALAKGPGFVACSFVSGPKRLWWRLLLDSAPSATSSATRFLDRLFPKLCQCVARRHEPGGQFVRQPAQRIHWVRSGDPLGFAIGCSLKPRKSFQHPCRLEHTSPLFRRAKRSDGKLHPQRPRHQRLSFASSKSRSHDSSRGGCQSSANHLLENGFRTRYG